MLLSSSETYPLTTIDLANLCGKTTGERYRALRDWRKPSVWRSYVPTKANWAKLIAREPSLDLMLERDDKERLLAKIARECRYGDSDVEANMAVSAAIWDWAVQNDAKSLSHEFSAYRTPLSTNRFFEGGIVIVGVKGYGVLLDPRRSQTRLDAIGLRFALSAMYWKIAGVAEYIDLNLAIMRISDTKPTRRVQLLEFSGPPEFTKAEVEERIFDTQRIWLDVQLERRDESAKGAGGL
ncbi:MAG: hypothetical protein ACT4OK_01605 [Gemmobacter sp.]